MRVRILWLTPYLPAPMFGAGTRVFNLIKALAVTCDIDLIASSDMWSEDNELLRDLRTLCRSVESVPPVAASGRAKRLLQLRSVVARQPAQYWIRHSPELQDRIDRAMHEAHYDVAVLEHCFMGYFRLPDEIPIVLDQHNVESDILLRASRHERSLTRRAYNLLEYAKFRRDEQRICRRADLIFATSALDREVMERWSGLPHCVVIPNGVDSTRFAPPATTADPRDGGHVTRVVFTGSMNYSPNTEAMLHFVGHIWPLIRGEVPCATLQIVGSAPPPEIVRLGQIPNVTVTGYVADVRPYLAAAQVVVVPLRIGGGTRLKILEAMAMGRAVVSTSLGCEGLDVQDGRHLVVADEPADFAGKVIDLLRDPARRVELGREGRRLVEEQYDWRALGMRMEAAIRESLWRMHAIP